MSIPWGRCSDGDVEPIMPKLTSKDRAQYRELVQYLNEVVEDDEFEISDIEEWCTETLGDIRDLYEQDYLDGERAKSQRKLYIEHKRNLLSLVKPYVRNGSLPEFTDGEPDGSLYGVGFIYDEDKDDRVIDAIDRLRMSYPSLRVVAVCEHEGEMNVYATNYQYLTCMDVCDDTWNLRLYLPINGEWREMTYDIVEQLVEKAIRK